MSHRRLLAAASLASVASLALAGCQPAPPAPSEAPAAGGATSTLACMVANSGNIEDRSFNQAVHESLEAAKGELGVDFRETVSQSAADYETNLQTMAGAGCGAIFTVGWELADATKAAAAEHPEIAYAIVDEQVDAPNVRSIVHDTAQAAFLAGYLAAGLSKTGVVGTFGGGNQPPVTVFMDGFQAGVERYDADKGADVRVVGWDRSSQQGSFTDDFTNSNTARTTAAGLISQGADIIMPVAAQAGEGAVTAALEAGNVGVIWVDSDGYELLPESERGTIVTTVEKHMRPAILEVIRDRIAGQIPSGRWVGTLANDGVGLAPFHDWEAKVPAELRTELDALRQQIVDGSLVVDSPSSPKL